MFFLLLTEGLLVSETDLQALYLSGTYCHKTGTRPRTYAKLRQLTINAWIVKINEETLKSQIEAKESCDV